MKRILLLPALIFYLSASCQHSLSTTLPAGRYETFVKQSQARWLSGDIILLNENQYKISSNNEVGEYKFSVSAQRLFFVSGPLKTVFAKINWNAEKPSILLPAFENERQGVKLVADDVVGYLKN